MYLDIEYKNDLVNVVLFPYLGYTATRSPSHDDDSGACNTCAPARADNTFIPYAVTEFRLLVRFLSRCSARFLLGEGGGTSEAEGGLKGGDW